MNFNCWSCGACCKIVGIAVESAKKEVANGSTDDLIKEVSNFPYHYEISGRCSKLGLDNRCEVYDTRPRICDAVKTYKHHHFKNMSWEEYEKISEQVCVELDELLKD